MRHRVSVLKREYFTITGVLSGYCGISVEFDRTTIQSWNLSSSCENHHAKRVRFRDCRKILTDD